MAKRLKLFEVPILNEVSKKLVETVFKELLLEDLDYILDAMNNTYKRSYISNFETILNEDDIRLELLSNDYYLKVSESKFINLLIDIFEKNGSSCIVDSQIHNLEENIFIDLLNIGIDVKYQYLLFNQYKNLIGVNSNYFEITDKELLKMFVIFGLRENNLNQFFLFPKNEICIFNNYDQLLPIYSKEEIILEDYEFNKNDLFLIK